MESGDFLRQGRLLVLGKGRQRGMKEERFVFPREEKGRRCRMEEFNLASHHEQDNRVHEFLLSLTMFSTPTFIARPSLPPSLLSFICTFLKGKSRRHCLEVVKSTVP